MGVICYRALLGLPVAVSSLDAFVETSVARKCQQDVNITLRAAAGSTRMRRGDKTRGTPSREIGR